MSLWAMVLQILTLAKQIERRLEAVEVEQVAQQAILEKILKAVTPAPAASIVLTLGVPIPKQP